MAGMRGSENNLVEVHVGPRDGAQVIRPVWQVLLSAEPSLCSHTKISTVRKQFVVKFSKCVAD